MEKIETSKNITIHHCHLFDIKTVLNQINQNDVLFFDDCLYSQYVFLKNFNELFRERHIKCVLGFSSYLFREEGERGIYDIRSDEIHKECNKHIKSIKDSKDGLKTINGFMTISEIKNLLTYDNISLALHGCCHLRLTDLDKFDQLTTFRLDLIDGMEMLNKHNLKTNIFVYPYEYSLKTMNIILVNYGFQYIFGEDETDRIELETLIG